MPASVPDAYPPRPFVTSHSRRSAERRSPQISGPKLTRGRSSTVSGGFTLIADLPPSAERSCATSALGWRRRPAVSDTVKQAEPPAAAAFEPNDIRRLLDEPRAGRDQLPRVGGGVDRGDPLPAREPVPGRPETQRAQVGGGDRHPVECVVPEIARLVIPPAQEDHVPGVAERLGAAHDLLGHLAPAVQFAPL